MEAWQSVRLLNALVPLDNNHTVKLNLCACLCAKGYKRNTKISSKMHQKLNLDVASYLMFAPTAHLVLSDSSNFMALALAW